MKQHWLRFSILFLLINIITINSFCLPFEAKVLASSHSVSGGVSLSTYAFPSINSSTTNSFSSLSQTANSSFHEFLTPLSNNPSNIDKQINISDLTTCSGINFPSPLFPVGEKPLSITTADFDDDGKLDLVTANRNSYNISVLKNTSEGSVISFATKQDFVVSQKPHAIVVGDFDNDGKLDLATADIISRYCSNSVVDNIRNNLPNTISILKNTSSNKKISFATEQKLTDGKILHSIVVGDFDDDGKLDLVIAGESLRILRNTSSDKTISFATEPVLNVGSPPCFVATEDFNRDGKLDLVIGGIKPSTNSQNISILINTSNDLTISFAAKQDFEINTNSVENIKVADFDKDNKSDLIILGHQNLVLKNTSTDTDISFIEEKLDTDSYRVATSAVVGDFNGDDKLDLAVAQLYLDNITIKRNTSSDKNISFDSVASNKLMLEATQEGIEDSMTSNTVNNTNHKNISNISFTTKHKFISSIQPGDRPAIVSLAAGDFNRDGKLDLVTTSSDLHMLLVLRNTSTKANISFMTNQIFKLTSDPFSLVAGDFNGDSKPDLVANNYNDTMSVLRNTSNSTAISFATKQDFDLGQSTHSLVAGDLNGDGKLDLVGINKNSTGVSALRNTSSDTVISFATKQDFIFDKYPYLIELGDFDGDGKPDIITANSDSNGLYVSSKVTVSVLRNTSSGTNISFAKPHYLEFGSTSVPRSILARDLNRDGKSDLVTIIYNHDNLSTLKYNAVLVLRSISSSENISFATVQYFRIGNYPYLVEIGDFSGDSKLDLVVFYSSKNAVVLKNTSSDTKISFAEKQDFMLTQGGARTSVVGDFDGDGKLDLTFLANSISVLQNTSQSSAISFATSQEFMTGSYIYSRHSLLVVADFDGDGKLDLATLSETGQKGIVIMKNLCLNSLKTTSPNTKN